MDFYNLVFSLCIYAKKEGKKRNNNNIVFHYKQYNACFRTLFCIDFSLSVEFRPLQSVLYRRGKISYLRVTCIGQ